LVQTKILLWKNNKILSRKKKVFFFMVFTPLMICVMLKVIQGITGSMGESGVLE